MSRKNEKFSSSDKPLSSPWTRTMSLTSFVLADGDWHYLSNCDPYDLEFRYNTLKEAQAGLEHASQATDIPVDEIVILKETREQVN